MRQDEDARAEIFQDVERCMPENLFFREPQSQTMLLNILFIYNKLNPDVGYRQGMHEILAPVLWVVSRDAVETHLSDDNRTDDKPEAFSHSRDSGHAERVEGSKGKVEHKELDLLISCLDQQFIEHDSFILFGIIMQTVKTYYETTQNSSDKPGTTSSSIAQRSRHIHEELLYQVDSELAEHLAAIDIIPQIFLIRWIRLLFGREFPFEEVLTLWDNLFAEAPSLDLVDLICVAMLLRIRWQCKCKVLFFQLLYSLNTSVIEADYSTALTLLLRYPPLTPSHSTCSLVADALILHADLSQNAGAAIITKYSKRPPQPTSSLDNRPAKQGSRRLKGNQPFVPRSFTPNLSPSKFLPDQGGFEAIIKGAAKGAYTRGEQWGVNKALRGAMQNLQAAATSPGKAIEGSGSSSELEALQTRNKILANLLGKAMDELWTQQRQLFNDKTEDEAAGSLSLAIAKIQFIQVYLENPLMPLVLDEEAALPVPGKSESASAVEVVNDNDPGAKGQGQDIDPSISDSPTRKPVHRAAPPDVKPPMPKDGLQAKPEGSRSTSTMTTPLTMSLSHSNPQRPAIGQSSFSWILGPDTDVATKDPTDKNAATTQISHNNSSPSVTQRRVARERAAYLFGDVPSIDENGKNKGQTGNGKGRGQRLADNDEENSFKLKEIGGDRQVEVEHKHGIEEEP